MRETTRVPPDVAEALIGQIPPAPPPMKAPESAAGRPRPKSRRPPPHVPAVVEGRLPERGRRSASGRGHRRRAGAGPEADATDESHRDAEADGADARDGAATPSDQRRVRRRRRRRTRRRRPGRCRGTSFRRPAFRRRAERPSSRLPPAHVATRLDLRPSEPRIDRLRRRRAWASARSRLVLVVLIGARHRWYGGLRALPGAQGARRRRAPVSATHADDGRGRRP